MLLYTHFITARCNVGYCNNVGYCEIRVVFRISCCGCKRFCCEPSRLLLRPRRPDRILEYVEFASWLTSTNSLIAQIYCLDLLSTPEEPDGETARWNEGIILTILLKFVFL